MAREIFCSNTSYLSYRTNQSSGELNLLQPETFQFVRGEPGFEILGDLTINFSHDLNPSIHVKSSGEPLYGATLASSEKKR